MKLTKDEARILAAALEETKFDFVSKITDTRDAANQAIKAFEKLEEALNAHGVDKRRFGRTSQNDFRDCLKRFCKIKK